MRGIIKESQVNLCVRGDVRKFLGSWSAYAPKNLSFQFAWHLQSIPHHFRGFTRNVYEAYMVRGYKTLRSRLWEKMLL